MKLVKNLIKKVIHDFVGGVNLNSLSFVCPENKETFFLCFNIIYNIL